MGFRAIQAAIVAPPLEVVSDPSGKDYSDEATRAGLADGMDNDDDFVAAFADKIPDTYGAPKRQPVAASWAGRASSAF